MISNTIASEQAPSLDKPSKSPGNFSRQRRQKLTSLSTEIDESTVAERQRCIRRLLQQPMLTIQSADNDAFFMIRRHGEWLKHWFAHHAGWSLFINSEVARLKKTAADGQDPTRPCRDSRNGIAFSKRRYVLLALTFSSLERAQRQTTLGHLAKDVVALIHGNEAFDHNGIRFSLESMDERRDFVQVLRKLAELHILERIHGNEERFVQNEDEDALYNVNHHILGRLLSTRQSPSLLSNVTPEKRIDALLSEVVADSDEARNRAIRIKFFRILLDDPVLYFDRLSENEWSYWEKQRPFIVKEITEQTGLVPELRKEGIAMVDPQGKLTDYGLPEEGTDGHLTLLIAEFLANRLRKKPDTRIPLTALYAHTAELTRLHKKHWRKNVTEPGMETTLTNQVLERLRGLRLIRRSEELVIPLPTIARYGLRQ